MKTWTQIPALATCTRVQMVGRGRKRPISEMHSMSMMIAANKKNHNTAKKGCSSFTQSGKSQACRGPEELGTAVQSLFSLTPQARVAEKTGPPPHFSFLSTHSSFLVASCVPTTLAPKHKGTFPPPGLCSSQALSLEPPALIPCSPKSCSFTGAQSQASPGRSLLLPEKSLTCCHSALLGPDDILSWWSVHCSPTCLPSLPLKVRSFLKARLRMT